MRDVFTAFICRLLVEQFTLKAYALVLGRKVLLLMQRIHTYFAASKPIRHISSKAGAIFKKSGYRLHPLS